MNFEDDINSTGDGYFVADTENKFLLYKIYEEIYKLELTSL